MAAGVGGWVAMVRSEVGGVGIWIGDGVLGPRWWLVVAYWSVGWLEMWAASCGAIVSLLVMLYLAVASWMVLWERRCEKKWMA